MTLYQMKRTVSYPSLHKQWAQPSSGKQFNDEDKGVESDTWATSCFSTQSVDQCPTCGIQTFSTVVKTKASSLFGKKKCTENRVPMTIEGAVLAGRCILCHPLGHKEQDAAAQPEARAHIEIMDQGIPGTIKRHDSELSMSTKATEESVNHQAESKPIRVVSNTNANDPTFLSEFLPTEMTCLALVAHNGMKPAMKDFVIANQNVLRKFRLTGTNSTMTMIREVFGDDPDVVYGPTCASGPLGGDAELVSLMVNKSLGGCFFFSDPMSAHPHTADIECLNRQANVHDIVMCPNLTSAATALATFRVALKEGLRKLIPSFFESLESPTVKSYKEGQRKLLSSVSSKPSSKVYGSDLIPLVASTRASLPYDLLKDALSPLVSTTHPSSSETNRSLVSSSRRGSTLESRRRYGKIQLDRDLLDSSCIGESWRRYGKDSSERDHLDSSSGSCLGERNKSDQDLPDSSGRSFLVSMGLSQAEATAVIQVAGITSSEDLLFLQDEATFERVTQESDLKIIPSKKLSKAIQALVDKEEDSSSGEDFFIGGSGRSVDI